MMDGCIVVKREQVCPRVGPAVRRPGLINMHFMSVVCRWCLVRTFCTGSRPAAAPPARSAGRSGPRCAAGGRPAGAHDEALADPTTLRGGPEPLIARQRDSPPGPRPRLGRHSGRAIACMESRSATAPASWCRRSVCSRQPNPRPACQHWLLPQRGREAPARAPRASVRTFDGLAPQQSVGQGGTAPTLYREEAPSSC
jgi:hypothetical protein